MLLIFNYIFNQLKVRSLRIHAYITTVHSGHEKVQRLYLQEYKGLFIFYIVQR